MKPSSDRHRTMELFYDGHNLTQISRELGIARSTLRDWRSAFWRVNSVAVDECARCAGDPRLPSGQYVYLLGLYLGDGCISQHARGVTRLRIACADAYPDLISACVDAMGSVITSSEVGITQSAGCCSVSSYSKHWPCLFPQHGQGKKHERRILLAEWQQAMVNADPWAFLRGLVHSDGCRSVNNVNGTPYLRYTFSNVSQDIKEIFCNTCDLVGVEWSVMNSRNISVARRASTALMDLHIGPKS